RAENSDGNASASSNELVWSDCVPPSTAASASIVVRMMLLYGSCAVRDHPDVWQCVRSIIEAAFDGEKRSVMSCAHSNRAARSLAISMRKFVPMRKKHDSRGADWATWSPGEIAARTYSSPSASVKASS